MNRHGNSSRLTLVFLSVLLPSAVTLVWLGWKILDQDRALAATREALQWSIGLLRHAGRCGTGDRELPQSGGAMAWQHISDEDLEGYHLGTVTDEAELAALEEHLLACSFVCRTRWRGTGLRGRDPRSLHRRWL